MCFYIGIEDLAANALINALSSLNRRFLTYREIESYGAEVVRYLNEQGEQAVLILSRERTDSLFRNYSEYFEESEDSGELGILLKKEIDVDTLIRAFRGYLAFDVLMAFLETQINIQERA